MKLMRSANGKLPNLNSSASGRFSLAPLLVELGQHEANGVCGKLQLVLFAGAHDELDGVAAFEHFGVGADDCIRVRFLNIAQRNADHAFAEVARDGD